jgi:hypothetical protein
MDASLFLFFFFIGMFFLVKHDTEEAVKAGCPLDNECDLSSPDTLNDPAYNSLSCNSYHFDIEGKES